MDFKDYRMWRTQAEKLGYKVIDHLTDYNGNSGNLSIAKDKNGNRVGEFLHGEDNHLPRMKEGGFLNSLPFQNGCARAEKEIQNKLQNAGMKVENARLKVGDRVKFAVDSDYVEPKDRNKVFTVTAVRGEDVQLNYGYFVPASEVYKV